MPPNNSSPVKSAGHKLGQIVGDWWERYLMLPLLDSIATENNLYLDNRFKERTCRGNKIQWGDEEGNFVDYDFVLEVNGDADNLGTPVGFIECFWRRGARHSKDKARDDTNKLLPMRRTYPSARFLSIGACGEFTEPAREYVRSRLVDLFYIPKEKIVAAFDAQGIIIDYPDNLDESDKLKLVEQAVVSLAGKEEAVAKSLEEVCGQEVFESYRAGIFSHLRATPIEIVIFESSISDGVKFTEIEKIYEFLSKPVFTYNGSEKSYRYQVVYSDGSDFDSDFHDFNYIGKVHEHLASWVAHIKDLSTTK